MYIKIELPDALLVMVAGPASPELKVRVFVVSVLPMKLIRRAPEEVPERVNDPTVYAASSVVARSAPTDVKFALAPFEFGAAESHPVVVVEPS
jgi:hypothetical protein